MSACKRHVDDSVEQMEVSCSSLVEYIGIRSNKV